MKIIGQRLRILRQNAKLSQARVAEVVGSRQSAVARYESGEAHVPAEMLVTLADYFDVSLDYILGRCDEPEGRLYKHQPKIGRGNPDMQRFVEMCFDPASPMNARLKETLFKMLEEET